MLCWQARAGGGQDNGGVAACILWHNYSASPHIACSKALDMKAGGGGRLRSSVAYRLLLSVPGVASAK